MIYYKRKINLSLLGNLGLDGGIVQWSAKMTPPVEIKLMQERVFKYSEVESAIAAIHNVSPAALKMFRSRIKNFQRIGMVSFSPGKGQKIDYKIIDVIRWALCFEFAELGLPPDQIKLIIRIC